MPGARASGPATNPGETPCRPWPTEGIIRRLLNRLGEQAGIEKRIHPTGCATLTRPSCVPRLMELLEERRAERPNGDDCLVTTRSARGRRRKMLAVIEAAGVEPWDQTWQTLRRSREVEWMNENIAPYLVCKWLGHTLSVSARHYTLAIPDEVLARVTGQNVTQKMTQHASAPERTAMQIA